jgi:hypothetical protein
MTRNVIFAIRSSIRVPQLNWTLQYANFPHDYAVSIVPGCTLIYDTFISPSLILVRHSGNLKRRHDGRKINTH